MPLSEVFDAEIGKRVVVTIFIGDAQRMPSRKQLVTMQRQVGGV